MKMIEKLKYVLLGAALMLCVIFVSSDAIAVTYEKLINVTTGVRIFIDDREMIPTDINNNVVDVLLYNGTTYLPVRAIAEFNDYKVVWDDQNSFVKLYTKDDANDDNTQINPSTDIAISPEDTVLTIMNELREENGLPLLYKEESLKKAAEIRVKELKSRFDHIRPTGEEWHTVLMEGVSYTIAGENLAMGYSDPQEVVEAWMGSEGHRENILESRFDRVGISHYIDSKGIHYWAQTFAGSN
ncbi:MAG: hypothetical protein GX633_04065 [Clostridiales bacterium]|nr:hypothetical protein [Clostridiales bacterium]